MSQSAQTAQNTNHISTVRQHLLDQLAAVRSAKGDNLTVELDRCKGVADIAQVIINTAKVEVSYLQATNQTHTPFLEVPPDVHTGNQPHSATPQLPNSVRNDDKAVVTRTNWVDVANKGKAR